MSDPAVEAARRATVISSNGWSSSPSANMRESAREALAPIREWWESGNGTNYDDLLPLIYADKELSDD